MYTLLIYFIITTLIIHKVFYLGEISTRWDGTDRPALCVLNVILINPDVVQRVYICCQYSPLLQEEIKPSEYNNSQIATIVPTWAHMSMVMIVRYTWTIIIWSALVIFIWLEFKQSSFKDYLFWKREHRKRQWYWK